MKRTAIERKAPMARGAGFKPAEPKPAAGPRPKKCKHCRSSYLPDPKRPWKTFCSDECALHIALADLAKQKAKKQRAERAKDKAKREGMKTYPQLIREVQAVFNKKIRARDQLAGFACISSGRPLDWSGNGVDAGHYRSTGSAPHLRFNEDNCHAQSKQDNRYGAGAAVDYRIGLINRIGLARVEALESDNTPRKWTHDELRALKARYAAEVRELKKAAPVSVI